MALSARSWHDARVVAKKELTDKDILCLGHLKRAFALLDRLHEMGCERDSAGNRELHFDDYCKLVLLYIWNPLIASVHDLQQAAALAGVAKALGVKRFSAGSFSESVRVFDPEQLKPIIQELAGELAGYPAEGRLGELKHILTLVDGTVLAALPKLARAACGEVRRDTRYNTSRDGKAVHAWKLHTQFDLETFSPHRLDRTGARNSGANRENNVLRRTLEAGRCYVGDGGYADRTLFDDITDIQSSYVIRTAGNSVFELVEERLLSQEALDGGVVRDALVRLDGANHLLRRVEVQVQPHPRRTRSGTRQTDLIILSTNLMDLPAELIGLIYQQRYTVELFFRIFKQLLGMRHLLSQREEGIDIQIYCSVIVCILIQLISGKKPNKAMRNIIGWYLLDIATEQDVIDFLNKPDNTGVKLRAKEALWKKLGF
jgi:Transposase DDE domain